VVLKANAISLMHFSAGSVAVNDDRFLFILFQTAITVSSVSIAFQRVLLFIVVFVLVPSLPAFQEGANVVGQAASYTRLLRV